MSRPPFKLEMWEAPAERRYPFEYSHRGRPWKGCSLEAARDYVTRGTREPVDECMARLHHGATLDLVLHFTRAGGGSDQVRVALRRTRTAAELADAERQRGLFR